MENKEDDLFNNPMVRSAMEALSPEEQEQYKRVGRYMYNMNYNATDPVKSVKDTQVDPLTPEQMLIQAEAGLKSGLDPNELSSLELYLIWMIYGGEWYKEFGWKREEVPEIPDRPDFKLEKDEKLRLKKYKKQIIEKRTGKKYRKKVRL
jgi:hypothetical protein